MITRTKIARIRTRAAGIASINLSLGVLAMLQSLREGSTGWTLFIWLVALQGVAIGFLTGRGWSDHLLDRTPPHRRVSAATGFAWSLLTYWGPIFTTFIFGLIMAQTQPDAGRPRSSLEGDGGICLFPIVGNSIQRVRVHLVNRLARLESCHE